MEAITIAGLAVVAAGGWYSALDLLYDSGLLTRKKHARNRRNDCFLSGLVSSQRVVKQMTWVDI